MSIFSQLFHFFGKKLAGASRGFTLVELLVVVTIMLILTSTLLINQQRFNSSTVLRALSYNIALSIRQAQTYGTSVREAPGGGFAAKSYGVNFDNSDPTRYVLFADSVTNNGIYQAGEKVQDFKLGQGYTISDICGTTSSSALVCSLNSLNIYFRRPNPDANFKSNSGQVFTQAYIEVKSPGGQARHINIYSTGQIAVGGLIENP